MRVRTGRFIRAQPCLEERGAIQTDVELSYAHLIGVEGVMKWLLGY